MDSLGDFCKQMMDTFSRKSVDDADKKSVSDAANVGLETRVIRTYDDVGLHGGKDDCEFCKSREGEWSYQEAIAKGIFARHPGCECEIDYKTKKGSWQRQSNWKFNEWKDIQDPQTIKMRQRYGADEKQFNPLRMVNNSGNINQNEVPLKLDLQLFAEKGLKRQSDNDLRQGIRTLKERIQEHEGYLEDPASHDDEWNSHTEKHKQGLLRHWKKEISNYKESIRNRKEELRRRGAKDE